MTATAVSKPAAGVRRARALAGAIVLMCVWAGLACGRHPVGPSAVGCAAPILSGDPNTSVPPRCVHFSGYEWVVKAGTRFDPGPNAWSDGVDNVWVDGQGLHLRITNRRDRWQASEVTLNRSLGYGTYLFRTLPGFDQLDPNVVFGMFTYDFLDPTFSHREIDIEFSPRLGFTPGANAHFTVQPFTTPRNTHSFRARPTGQVHVHSFEWRETSVTFQSGEERWTYSGPGVPPPGAENVRINLWLFNGEPPIDGVEAHVVVADFQYRP